MHLHDLVDPEGLAYHVEEGNINVDTSEDGTRILYTVVTGNKDWDDVTSQCTGIVTDAEGYVLARPLRRPIINPSLSDSDVFPEFGDTPVVTYDLLDCPVGVVYWDNEGSPKVAVGGELDSDLTRHANQKLEGRLIPNFPNITLVVGVVSPDTQAVVDYKGIDSLFLVGGVDVNTGKFLDPVDVLTEIRGVYPHGGFDYLVQDYAYVRTAGEAFNVPPRENRAGLMLSLPDSELVVLEQKDHLRALDANRSVLKESVWATVAFDVIEGIGIPDEVVIRSLGDTRYNLIKDSGGTDGLEDLLSSATIGVRNYAHEYAENLTKNASDTIDQLFRYVSETEPADESILTYNASKQFDSYLVPLVVSAVNSDDRFDLLAEAVLAVVEYLGTVVPGSGITLGLGKEKTWPRW